MIPVAPPWALVDTYTVDQAITLLQRLTAWLDGNDTDAAAHCADALSLGETDDPIAIAHWTDGIALGLERALAAGTIDPELD